MEFERRDSFSVTIELDTPTNAGVMPMKFKRRGSFSATNASHVKQSSPTSY
jgi:hypothetical protein